MRLRFITFLCFRKEKKKRVLPKTSKESEYTCTQKSPRAGTGQTLDPQIRGFCSLIFRGRGNISPVATSNSPLFLWPFDVELRLKLKRGTILFQMSNTSSNHTSIKRGLRKI